MSGPSPADDPHQPRQQQPSAPGSAMPPAVPLDYAGGTTPRGGTPPELVRRRMFGAFRQVVLGVGLALFGWGLGQSILHVTGGPGFMAGGGLLFGMALPLRRGDRLW